MLNPFPDLLTYGILAPTILRLAAGAAFAYGAYFMWKHASQLAEVRLPIIGKASWVGGASAVGHLVIGAMLIVGFYTQIAALLGIAAAVKGAIFAPRYATLAPFTRAAYLLLLVILISLLLTGAGAFARDLPL